MSLPALVPALVFLIQVSPAAPVAAPPPVQTATVPVADTASPASAPPVSPGARAVRRHHAKGDPFERYNRYFFARQQGLDRKFLRPVALGYKHVVPNLLRTGLRNFFSNLGEPLVFLNYVLQLKPGKAAETATRFFLNSTIGIGGAVDVAKSPAIRLPHRPNGFGDTLGYYGVKPGPYLFLPLLGPTTLRDLFGGQAEALVVPFLVGTPFDRAEYQVTRAVTTGLDARAEADADYRALLDDAVDPYATFRSVFLQDREAEIDHLHAARQARKASGALDDPLADPAAGTGSREVQSPPIDPAASLPAQPTTAPPMPELAMPEPSTARELRDPLDDPAAPAPVAPPVPAPATH